MKYMFARQHLARSGFAVALIPVVAVLGFGSAAMAAEPAFEYAMECSDSRLRAINLRLQWPAEVTSSDTRIDVSVYKDGFETGRFVSIAADDPGRYPKGGVAFDGIKDHSQKYESTGEAMELRLEALTVMEKAERLQAIVSGFIPGVNYYVRLSGTGDEVARTRAPICPVDPVHSDEERPR